MDQYIVALEVSSSKIVGAVAVKHPTGSLSVIAIEEEKIIDSVRFGCIQNIDDIHTRLGRIIKKLENRNSVSPKKIKSVYVGIGGKSVRSILHSIEYSLHDDVPINEDLIKSFTREIRRESFDGHEILDIIPSKFTIDKAEVRNPVGMMGNHITADFNIIMGRQQLRGNLKRVIEERLQISIKGYIVSSVAIGNKVLSYDERQLGCMLVDFGAETTTVSIYKDNVLKYLFTMPIGSRFITKDLTSLKILEERAEDIKITIGNAKTPDTTNLNIEGINSADASSYIIARAGEISANIVAQLEYAKITPNDIPGGIILVGGGAKLKEFDTLLASSTKLKVRKAISASSINLIDSQANGLEHVSIVSILAEAADYIKADDTCCEAPTIIVPPKPDDDSQERRRREEQMQKENEKAAHKQKSVFKLFDKLKAKAENIFRENEDIDDDDEN